LGETDRGISKRREEVGRGGLAVVFFLWGRRTKVPIKREALNGV